MTTAYHPCLGLLLSASAYISPLLIAQLNGIPARVGNYHFPFSFLFPAGKVEILKWLFTWPLCFLLYFTVPNCNKPHLEKWFMITFASSTLWIAAFSYVMVWMVCIKQDGSCLSRSLLASNATSHWCQGAWDQVLLP